MTDLLPILTLIAGVVLCAYAVKTSRDATAGSLEWERQRTADWWARSQAHIDNLQDRVVSVNWEVYAQISEIDKPSALAQEDLMATDMAQDLLRSLRQQTENTYPDDVPDIAYDQFGPIVG